MASAVSHDYFQPMLEVGGSPTHVPGKRLESTLAGQLYPYAASSVRESPLDWADLVTFMPNIDTTVTYEANTPRVSSLYAEAKDAVIAVEREVSWTVEWTVTVAAKSQKIAKRISESLLTFIGEYPPPPEPEPLPYNIVPVDFWMQDPHTGGGYSRRRHIEVQKFSEVVDNYPSKLREELSELMAMDDPAGGKLVLLHGPPGTGKTRAILSIISEWRNWCGASVVTDADKLFDDATYLNSIVFNSEGQGWLLLIVEDGDEFMNVGSRDSKGQAIARLLNLADGIVGQGIRLLTIISTNVDMKELNPAVVRSGRCMANLHFGEFPEEEANEWLAANGVEIEVDKATSLADLYAIKGGKTPTELVEEQAEALADSSVEV